MARSIWKGPFVDGYLLKKAEVSRASGVTRDQDWSGVDDLPQSSGSPRVLHGMTSGDGHPKVTRRIAADRRAPAPGLDHVVTADARETSLF